MEKLKDKFNDILNDSLVYWEEVDFNQHNEECANEAKKLAIEFAKRLMSTEVCSKRIGRVESGYECSVEYPHSVPPEYSLMYGELVRFGDKMFDKFIEDYYA